MACSCFTWGDEEELVSGRTLGRLALVIVAELFLLFNSLFSGPIRTSPIRKVTFHEIATFWFPAISALFMSCGWLLSIPKGVSIHKWNLQFFKGFGPSDQTGSR